MIQLLFFIILGIAIYKNIQKVKENNRMTGNNAGPDIMANQPDASGRPTAPVNRNTQMGRAAKQTAVVKPAVKETKEDGNSTTAYLKEKAEEDARQHAIQLLFLQRSVIMTIFGVRFMARYTNVWKRMLY